MHVLQDKLHHFEDILTTMQRKQDTFLASAASSLPSSPFHTSRFSYPASPTVQHHVLGGSDVTSMPPTPTLFRSSPLAIMTTSPVVLPREEVAKEDASVPYSPEKVDEMARLLRLKKEMEVEYQRAEAATRQSGPTLTEKMMHSPTIKFAALPEEKENVVAAQPAQVKPTAEETMQDKVEASEKMLAAKREDVARYLATSTQSTSAARNPIKQALMVNTSRYTLSPSLRDDDATIVRTSTPSHATSYRSMTDHDFVDAYRQHAALSHPPRSNRQVAFERHFDEMTLSPREAMHQLAASLRT